MSDPRYSQGMSWIKERLPTKDDADQDGEVAIPRYHLAGNLKNDPVTYKYFALVVAGQPLWSDSDFEVAQEGQ